MTRTRSTLPVNLPRSLQCERNTPSNTTADGKYRKVKVELVAPDGGPLTVTDQKGKKLKWVVYAREGYTAPKGGVGD